jgi:alpha-1,2-rhamnosyltransferase
MTWAYGGNTGIQRVVRNYINQARSVSLSLGILCQPVIWKDGRWESIEALSPEPALGTGAETLGMKLLRLSQRLALACPERVKNILFDYRLRRCLRSAILVVANVLETARTNSAPYRLRFQPDDVLVLLDSSWHMAIWPGVSDARRQGARVGIMLYDLVPVVMPQMCVPELVASFKNWVKQAVRHADFCVCISRTVAEESRRYLEDRSPEFRGRDVPFGSIRLGADLDLTIPEEEIRLAVRDVFDAPRRPKTYLCVGTIEPRKNHWYLLDAFDSAWIRGAEAGLCIVGKKGWKCDHVLERIARHPQLGRRLFMFNDLSDGELKYCYGKARAVILPSLSEGFGLPVVEALSLGCRVWASDIPVLREVGGEYCLYFDLGSPQALAELIMNDDRGELAGPIRSLAGFSWPDWQESCRELLEKILELSPSIHKLGDELKYDLWSQRR